MPTTNSKANAYKTTHLMFGGLFKEMRELSKKKPELILSKEKVRTINRILNDIKAYLKSEPEIKYLELLDDDDLPQHSDAVLTMDQYEAALSAFHSRYYRWDTGWNTFEKSEVGDYEDENLDEFEADD